MTRSASLVALLCLWGSGAMAQALVYPGDSPTKATTAPKQAAPVAQSTPAAPIKAEAPAGVSMVVLQATNKITARSQRIEAPVGTLMRYGNLEIVAQRCNVGDDASALLDIWELKPSERPAQIFNGWMFAASPSLSSLQHAVYDVALVGCQQKTGVQE